MPATLAYLCSMKKTLVFGATGLAGSQIVAESLKAEHQVTAYIRQETYPLQHQNLHIVKGNLEDENAIQKAMEGQEVIVSAVGNMNLEDSTMVVTPLVKRILAYLKPTQRLIILLGSGSLLHDFKTMRRDLPNQSAMFRYPRADHWETLISVSPLDVDYTFVCPPQIKAGEADGNYNTQKLYFPADSQAFITAGNIGQFVANEIEKQIFLRTRVGIATKNKQL